METFVQVKSNLKQLRLKSMIENFEVFYKAFLQFSVNTARRIVKDENIAN